MGVHYYSVQLDGKSVAQHMELDDALTLTDALFHKYFMEPKISITIVREDEEGTLHMESEIEDVSYNCVQT